MQSSQHRIGPEASLPRYVVVMGVCGVGKTTTAQALAGRLGGAFVEADELHPPENVALMAAGRPLDDGARWPWLEGVCTRARDLSVEASGPVVIACSALKPGYRDIFRARLEDVVFLHLAGPADEIRRRLNARTGHFMPPSLLDSQLADLDVPGTETDLVPLSIERPADAVVEEAIVALAAAAQRSATQRKRLNTEERP